MGRRTHKKRGSRRQRRQQQNGGGWGYNGPAFAPAGGMAPEAARALTDDCAVLERPAPSVVPTGAWSQAGGSMATPDQRGGGCSSCAVLAPPMASQQGGMWPFNGIFEKKEEEEKTNGVPDVAEPLNENPVSAMNAPSNNVPSNNVVPPNNAALLQSGGRKSRRARKQRGGGGGGGGYGFQLNNDLGKVYASLPVGPCPSAPQKGGAVSLGDASLVSYPAGYGYGPASAMEVGNGSAHFLAQIPYGKQCMGGGARKATGGKGGARRRHMKSHRRHRKSHKSHKKSHRRRHH